MNISESSLQNHIEKVLAFKSREHSEKLTLEELKELDLSMGMTDREWDAMMQGAEDSLQMAHNHLRKGNAAEAAAAAESSVAVNPYLAPAYLVLAKAYLQIWQSDGDAAMLSRAELNARECLRLDTNNNEAYSALAQCSSANAAARDGKSKQRLMLALAAAAVLALVLMFWARSCSTSSQSHQELLQQEELLQSAEAQLSNTITRRNSLISDLLHHASKPGSKALKADVENLLSQSSGKETGSEQYYASMAQLSVKLAQISRYVDTSDKAAMLYIIQMEGAENRIATEKKRYNDAVARYNMLVHSSNDASAYQLREYVK